MPPWGYWALPLHAQRPTESRPGPVYVTNESSSCWNIISCAGILWPVDLFLTHSRTLRSLQCWNEDNYPQNSWVLICLFIFHVVGMFYNMVFEQPMRGLYLTTWCGLTRVLVFVCLNSTSKANFSAVSHTFILSVSSWTTVWGRLMMGSHTLSSVMASVSTCKESQVKQLSGATT